MAAMRLNFRITLCLALALALAVPAAVSAHSGGLNSEGCHNDRKTGDYHCHRGGGASTPRQDRAPAIGLAQAEQMRMTQQEFTRGTDDANRTGPKLTI